MSSLVERGIRRLAEAGKSLVRGYSLEEEAIVKRILSGTITPENRKQYEIERWYRYLCFFSPFVSSTGLETTFVDPRSLKAANEELRRLINLPENQLDQEVQDNARQKAARWGLKLTV